MLVFNLMRLALFILAASACVAQSSTFAGPVTLAGPAIFAGGANTALGATTNNVTLNSAGCHGCAFTLPSTPAIGDTILIFAELETAAATWAGCADNQASGGNTYTGFTGALLNSFAWMQIFWANVVKSSGPFTITCTNSSVATTYDANISAGEYTGLSASLNLDGSITSHYNGFAGNCNPGAISTLHAADIIFGGVGSVGSTTYSAGAGGFAIPSGANSGKAASEYLVTSSTGTPNPGFTLSPSAGAYCMGVAVY